MRQHSGNLRKGTDKIQKGERQRARVGDEAGWRGHGGERRGGGKKEDLLRLQGKSSVIAL